MNDAAGSALRVGFTDARVAYSILDVPPRRVRAPSLIAGAGALGVHAGLVVLATLVGTSIVRPERRPPIITQMIDVELPQPAAETLPADPPVPVPEPARAPAHARARAADATRSAPPPAAAQAGHVLAAAEDVVDFGDTLATGKGTFAGGVTQTGGTADHAVRDSRARAGGVEGGRGTDLDGDRSRAPRLAGSAQWDCPFPVEADDAGVDHAVVALRVEVGADGRVIDASTTADPGHGFGREAKRCALSKRWAAGLDRAGNPAQSSAIVNVRFDR